MKIAVFGPERRIGVLAGDHLIDVAAAQAELDGGSGGAVLPGNLSDLITAGDAALDTIEEILAKVGQLAPEAQSGGRKIRHSLGDVTFQPPVELTMRVFNIAANFADHMHSSRVQRGDTVTVDQVASELRAGGIRHFIKHVRNVIGHDAQCNAPHRSSLLDYEAEIVAIIGSKIRDVTSDHESYIWGYTMQNDLSIRGLPGDLQHQKNFDTGFSLGPWMVVREGLKSDAIDFQCHVNGEQRQSGNTANMVFSFADAISYFTQDQTLYPGDMISGGTSKGTAIDSSPRVNGAPDPKLFLTPGDTVEVSSSLIGTLRNKVA